MTKWNETFGGSDVSKKVRLIWVNGPFAVIEICNLLDEEDIQDLYYFVDDVIVASVEEVIREGMVMFEDDQGIFSLRAHQIVAIEDV